jgi:colicin import membrane protein
MGQELITIDQLNPADVFVTDGLDTILTKIETECRAVVLDATTEEGREQIKSLAYKIARSKTAVDNHGKTLVEDWKKKAKEIDAVRNTAWDRLEALQKEIRKPVDEFEAAEEKRVKEHNDALALLRSFEDGAVAHQTVQSVEDAIKSVGEVMQRDWQEFAKIADEAGEDTLKALQAKLAERQKYVADQAELERLRKEKEDRDQADRDAEIRRTAEEEGARKERERPAGGTGNGPAPGYPSPKPAQGAVPTVPSAMKAHKAKINNEAAAALVKLGISKKLAVDVVTAIAQGKVPNVVITY